MRLTGVTRQSTLETSISPGQCSSLNLSLISTQFTRYLKSPHITSQRALPIPTMPPKRDYKGNPKSNAPKVPVVRNEYTPMFERFRDELDEHHDRRERIVKASRDVTALSKKM